MKTLMRKLLPTPFATAAMLLAIGLAHPARATENRLFGVDFNINDTPVQGGHLSKTQSGFVGLGVDGTANNGNGDAGATPSFTTTTLSNVASTGIGVLVSATGGSRDRGSGTAPNADFPGSNTGFFPAASNAMYALLQDDFNSNIKVQLTGLANNTTYHMKTYHIDANGGQVTSFCLGKYQFGTGSGSSFAGGAATQIGYAWEVGNIPNPLTLVAQSNSTGSTVATGAGTGMLDFTFTTGSPANTFQFFTGSTATMNGFELYQVVAGVVADAGTSTATAAPSTVPADGTTTSTVTVTLKDNSSSPVAGKTVTLVSSRSGSDTVSAASGVSSGTGVVTFTVSSATPGSSSYTATDTTDSVTVTQAATVIFTGPPNAGTSTVAAAPSSVPANGSSTSTVTVTLKDVNSNPIAGKTVTLASDRGATDTISAASGVSNASGVVTFTVKSLTPGTPNFTAADSTDSVTVTATTSVTFTVIPPADTAQSTVTAAPTTQVANGSSTSTITVTLKDGSGNPVSGKTVTLASDRGATDTISAASGTSTLAGVVTFTVKSTTAGAPNFTATDTTDSVVVAATTSVTFTWPVLVANAGSAKSVYTGFPATIGGTPAATGGDGVYTFAWTPDDGSLSSVTVANPIASPTVTTTYTLTVTDTAGSTPATSQVVVSFTVPNPNLASVDFMQGSGITCSGDTTLTGTTMKNAVGNTFTGQAGSWNALNIGTYNNSSAISGFLNNGAGTQTTVKLALGLATGLDATTAGNWRCSPNEGGLGGADQLRAEIAYLYGAVSTADHYAWAITGLQPSGTYRLTFFGIGSNSTTSNVAFPGTAQQDNGVKDSENDWNWTAVTADSTGKISGTFTDPSNNGAASLCGMQIEGTLPLAPPPLVVHPGADKSVSAASPSVVIGDSPAATGGSGTYSTYSWSPPDGLSDPNVANPTASPTVTTTYYLTVTDSLGAEATASMTVTYIVGSAYDTWAATNAGGGAPSEDFNHDGVQNGIAYFMGMNGLATLPGVVGGTVTWPHVGTVTAFEVQVSTDLVNWTAADPASVDSTTDPTQVVYTLPIGAARTFCRLSVTP